MRDDGRMHLLAAAGADSIIFFFFFFEKLTLLLVNLMKHYTLLSFSKRINYLMKDLYKMYEKYEKNVGKRLYDTYIRLIFICILK